MTLLRHVLDLNAADGGSIARQTGRSWWSLRYLSGDVVNEWDADPGSPTGHADWPRLAMLGKLKRTQALRLFCPNGKMAQVEVPGGGDATGRLFQFKDAARHVAARTNGHVATLGREVLAHVIGVIVGLDGQCVLFAWQLVPEPEPPQGYPHVPPKPDCMNREQPLWALKEQHQHWLEARDREDEFLKSQAVVDYRHRLAEWRALEGGGQLVGPIKDNVFQMTYLGGRALNADHLGMTDGEGR